MKSQHWNHTENSANALAGLAAIMIIPTLIFFRESNDSNFSIFFPMIEFFPKPIFFWKNIINYKILLTYCKYPRQIVINTKYSDCKYSAIIISEGIIELQISVIMIRECRFLNFNVSQSCWAFCHWKISQISGPFPLKYPCFCPKSPWGGVILALFYPKIAIFGFQLLAINPGFLSLKNISTVMWFLFHHKHPWCVKFEEKAIFSVTNQLVFFRIHQVSFTVYWTIGFREYHEGAINISENKVNNYLWSKWPDYQIL